MATIIDAFVVTLGLDRTQYKKEMASQQSESKATKDALKNDANEVEDVARRSNEARTKRDKQHIEGQKAVKDSLEATKRQAIETFAVLVGANSLKQYIASTTDAAVSTLRMATAAGVGVQDLSAFGAAIRRNGGDAESAKGSIAGLARALEQARTMGVISPQLNSALGQIGAGLNDDPTLVFEKFAGWSEGKDPRLVAQTGAQLGFDDGSISEAMKGRKAAEADIEQARKLGAVNDEQARKLKELQGEWRQFGEAIGGVALEMLTDVSPAITTVLHGVEGLVEKFPMLTKVAIAAAIGLGAFKGAVLGRSVLSLLGGGAAAEGAAGTAAAGVGAGALGIGGLVAGGILAVGGYAVSASSAGDANESDIVRNGEARWRADRNGGVAGRAAQIKAYWMSKGYSSAEVDGIVAAMRAENSTLDPSRTNPISAGRSNAYGLGQWLGSRQGDFRRWSGHDIKGSSLQQQLDFMNYEMTQGQFRTDVRGRSSQGAAYSMLTSYYRPGAGLAGDVGRANRALGMQQNIQIASVTVQTAATDSKGIARDFRKDLGTTGFVQMADSGVN